MLLLIWEAALNCRGFAKTHHKFPSLFLVNKGFNYYIKTFPSTSFNNPSYWEPPSGCKNLFVARTNQANRADLNHVQAQTKPIFLWCLFSNFVRVRINIIQMHWHEEFIFIKQNKLYGKVWEYLEVYWRVEPCLGIFGWNAMFCKLLYGSWTLVE